MVDLLGDCCFIIVAKGFGGPRKAEMNSFAHYSLCAVCEWMFSQLAGIQTDGVGYRRIVIRPTAPSPGSEPDQDPIDWSRAHCDSIRGRMASAWKAEDGQFHLGAAIPANTTATVFLAGRDAASMAESGKSLTRASGGGPSGAGGRIRDLPVHDGSKSVKMNPARRRFFLYGIAVAVLALGLAGVAAQAKATERRSVTRPPNILFVLADQWRAEAFGYAGNPDVKTPNLDRLRSEGVHFLNALSAMPVCCPTRASILTGQRPLTHGVFLNDVPLNPEAVTIGKVLRTAGYDTAYIGKWHVDGHGRSSFIPRERRQGFDYWKVLECTHDYNHSAYYADGPEKLYWEGYDAIAQTRDAQLYLRDHAQSQKPFFLVVAWGPPHDPYFTAPEKYRALYDPARLTLRPNVPGAERVNARKVLAGYYAHCTALDDCVGELRRTLQEIGLAEDTLLVFTSDHGDMLGSQGAYNKQRPYDESIRVPFLMRWPKGLGARARELEAPINSEDIMPTLLGLCGVPIPKSVEGLDYSGYLRGGRNLGNSATMILCASPFGQWERRNGGKEYRGVRTTRYTYVRDLAGPWLLYDNQTDPYQTNNLANLPKYSKLQGRLEATLNRKLKERHDDFLPGDAYIKQWGYTVDANGTVPYKR